MNSTNRKHVYLAEIEDGRLVYVDDTTKKRERGNRPTKRLFIGRLDSPMRYARVLRGGRLVESDLMFVATELGELSWYPNREDERPRWNSQSATKLAFKDYELDFSRRRFIIRKKANP